MSNRTTSNNRSANTSDRTKRKLARHGRRMKRRSNYRKNPGEVEKILGRVKNTLVNSGDYVEGPDFKLVVPNGIEAYVVAKRGYKIIVVGPAAAMDEAVARIEEPEAPKSEPISELSEVRDSLKARGDIPENDDATSGAIVEGMYASLGCAACNAQGVTMGEVADEMTGILPLLMMATQKDDKGFSPVDRLSYGVKAVVNPPGPTQPAQPAQQAQPTQPAQPAQKPAVTGDWD